MTATAVFFWTIGEPVVLNRGSLNADGVGLPVAAGMGPLALKVSVEGSTEAGTMYDLVANLGLGFATALTPVNLALCFVGCLVGTLVAILIYHAGAVVEINHSAGKSTPTATSDLIYCSPNQIKQACVAMLVNASESLNENGDIIIRTLNPNEETVRFEIVDNGIGISVDDIPHIFEPFFSTKHNASGIGLGLAIVHGIMQSHNGKIQVKSEPAQGTTFSITLPLI
ncbi:MAG: ATP-binding protein, partial [Actinomycetota bacterium]